MDDIDFLNDDEYIDLPKVQVTTPSGATVSLLTDLEKDYYERVSQRYQTDNKFVNMSDLQELDRILVMETMVFRWSQWVLEEKDYFGEPIDMIGTQRNIESYSKEIRGLKKDLGIDKGTREKDQGDSLADYISKLGQRAKEFGVMRNKQAVAAITILKEVQAKLQLHLNMDDVERAEFKWNEKEFIDWLIGKFDEFDKIDAEFRATSQKYYIREM